MKLRRSQAKNQVQVATITYSSHFLNQLTWKYMDPDPKPIKQNNVEGNTKKESNEVGEGVAAFGTKAVTYNWFMEELVFVGRDKRKPSEALKRIQNLNVNKDDIFQAIWLGKLPLHVQRGLTTLTHLPMKELAAKADKLMKLPPNIEG